MHQPKKAKVTCFKENSDMTSETTVIKDANGGFFRSATYRLEQTQTIPKAKEEVFDFFSDAHNLERLTHVALVINDQ